MPVMDPALSEIVERLRAAAADARPVRLRGGGTKDFYGQSLQGEVLDTRTLQGIVSYEPSELVVTVRAGTPLAELQAVLADKGQALAFDPPHFGAGATVGGMLAAGLSGPSRASVGSVRDYVLGVQMVNGRAELLQFGGQVMKNVAGYDVSRLLCGSLGTLGLVTEVSLKVLPRPVAQATLRFALGQAAALQQLQRWAGQPLPLRATCWVQDAGQDLLYVRLAGARAAVAAAVRVMGGVQEDEARAPCAGSRHRWTPWRPCVRWPPGWAVRPPCFAIRRPPARAPRRYSSPWANRCCESTANSSSSSTRTASSTRPPRPFCANACTAVFAPPPAPPTSCWATSSTAARAHLPDQAGARR
jgi:glycolate oxidase FAD binding subunit